MSDDYRSGQGTIVPTLFIGLGGTGSRIVDRIAERAQHLPNWESQLRPLTHFVSVDTNELDQNKLRAVPPGNRINIAAFDKARVIDHFRRSNDLQALQWLDRGYKPRKGFKPGAGQIRVESRLGFFYHSVEIRQRLTQLVLESLASNIVWRQSAPPNFYVYLFSTLAGGTGSGSFLSMAYLVREIIEAQRWQPRIIGNLMLSTLLLEVVGPELHPDIHANTYAALKELEHLTKLDYSEVKDQGRVSEPFVYWRDENRREPMDVESRPFFLAFIHDRPPHLSLRDPQAAIADAAFLQVFTPIIGNLASELDNYEKHLEGLTRFPGNLRDVGHGYSKNFGVFGAAALVLPGHDLLEYCTYRFAAQALRAQITFGVDREASDDERSRALARLAVDYSAPKFLAMSDEGREQAIHQAFIASVREMARQDEREEVPDGYWQRLVDRVEQGEVLGRDEQGKEQRGESLLDRLSRQLKEARQQAIQQLPPIKEKAFVFHREGVNQYAELVSRLETEVQKARAVLDESARGIELAATEGEVVTDLKLDPIAERYLVLRLLNECSTVWIPKAREGREKAGAQDISNPKARERLKVELFESLREAAADKKLFRRGDQAFLDARDEAQDYYRKVVEAARRVHGADLELRQLRHLEEYLQARARQYARLASHIDGLVLELEGEAEQLRRGETAVVRQMALRVEIFETLDEPRRRLWDAVYRALFIDKGRHAATFDRQILAEAIAEQLQPVLRADGRVVQRSTDQTVEGLRHGMLSLGRERLRPTIFGGDGRSGLDLQRGLDLEARLVLGDGGHLTADAIKAYILKKIRALSQLAGVLARVDASDARALDDGVVVNRTRQLVVGLDRRSEQASRKFAAQLESELEVGGFQVKTDTWHDPQIAIVHDVVLPIPLYYVQAVVGDIEDAYLRLAADEKRPYHLHTDFHWEKTLPNLNPERSEVAVDWSLRQLVDALITRVVTFEGSQWRWRLTEDGAARELGATLASALYRLSEIHRNDDLRGRFQERLRTARDQLTSEQVKQRIEHLLFHLEDHIGQLGLRELDGALTNNDVLDRPILRALHQLAGRTEVMGQPSPDGVALSASGYERFNADS